ncbi:cytidylate kinase [Peptoniphilus duerdenii ATCC BAA-1640]|uniref:Cytidylate kinase n=1 Tax=Peptoniphilus duerdenii ATCC BAA-1640 TaxID=862517 RepID=E0NMW1_9FIRM|nr:(d)CMP kinase [Peptoniphilus duerdenii]EFM24929.1 cytidylate kinase [Peptoniphilus duerdenii ATCC BAA-1640]
MKIAIDGPAGSGKSTIAKKLAKTLGIEYIDTGAMYRALAFYMNENNLSLQELKNEMDLINIEFKKERTFINGKDISDFIRTNEISSLASKVSKDKEIREKLVDLQRKLADKVSCVMEGRDITSVVLKDAEYKFYLDANPMVRAKRRLNDLKGKDSKITLDELIAEIEERDKRDKTRENSPLQITKDSNYIDTSEMTVEDVVNKILSYVGD